MTSIITIRKVTDEVVDELYGILGNNYPWDIALDEIAHCIAGVSDDISSDLNEALFILWNYWKNDNYSKEVAIMALSIIMERLGRSKELRNFTPNI